MYGMYGTLDNCIFQPSDLVGLVSLLQQCSKIPSNPSSQRADFALIAPAAQAERHSDKSDVIPPANTLETRPFAIPVGDAETGTLYGIAEVEKSRNSERRLATPSGVESAKI